MASLMAPEQAFAAPVGLGCSDASDTSAADFAAGTPNGVQVASTNGGELTLPLTQGWRFDSPDLPTGWAGNVETISGRAYMANGRINFDGVTYGSTTSFGQNVVLDFDAIFSAEPYQHAGLAASYQSSDVLAFSTQYDGKLYTYTNGVVKSLGTQYLNSMHHYRVERNGANIRYLIDGVQVATGTYASTLGLRPLFSDTVLGTPLSVDNVGVSPYSANGNFTSRIFDAGSSVVWTTADWHADVLSGTTVSVSVRGGASATPNGSWSSWLPLASSGATMGLTARYMQYKVDLATTTAFNAPVFRDITLRRVLDAALCAPGNAVTDGGNDGFVGGTATDVVVKSSGVSLPTGFGSTFSDQALPDSWVVSPLFANGGANVSNLQLKIDGANVGPHKLFGPDTTLSFDARFSGDRYEHAGFGINFLDSNALIFSTREGGRFAVYTQGTETPLSSSYLNTWHRYSIARSATAVTYSIDGAVVATHAYASVAEFYPLFTNYDPSGNVLTVDNVSITPYYAIGTYESRVLDAGQFVNWKSALWAGDQSDNGSLVIFARTGDAVVPDATWSDWRQVGLGGNVGGSSRYLQYRAVLETLSDISLPSLSLIRFNYEIPPPPTTTTTTTTTMPPTTTTTAPPPPPHYDTTLSAVGVDAVYGASGIAVSAAVHAGIAVDGGAVAFTLSRDGVTQGSYNLAVHNGQASGMFPLAKGTSVGDYSLSAHYTGTTTFSGSDATDVVSITPAPLTVNVLPSDKIYGQENPAFAVGYAGFVADDDASVLSGQLSFATVANLHSGVGSYTVSASGITASNYEVQFVDSLLTVNRAQLSVTVDDAARTFGAPNPVFSVRYAGFVDGDSAASLGGSLVFGTSASVASDAGTYIVSASGLLADNYDIRYLPGVLTVSRAAVIVKINDETITYGQPVPAYSASFQGLPEGVDPSSLGVLSITSNASSSSGAGYYSIEGYGLSSSNFDIEVIPGTLTVLPATLDVRVIDTSKVYGATLPQFGLDYSGFVNNDNASSLKGRLLFSTTADSSSAVGTYGVNASGFVSANYEINFLPGVLTVTPVVLTATVGSYTKAYGAANPVFGIALSGFVNDDDASNLGSGLAFSTAADIASSVGSYVVEASGLVSTNYEISFVPGVLNVTPVDLVITADNKSKTYGSANPSLTASYLGLVNGDTPAKLDGSLVLSTTAAPSSGVGTYPVNVSGVSSPNYVTSFVAGTLTVNKANLIITADNKSKNTGDANPVLTATYLGFINDDTPAKLNGSLLLSTTAVQSSPAGAYPIKASGVSSSNYAIAFVDGVLTVTDSAKCDVSGGLRDEAKQKKRDRGKLAYRFDCNGQIGKILLSKWKLNRVRLDCKTLQPKGNEETVFVYKGNLLSLLALLSDRYSFDDDFEWADDSGDESCWKMKLIFDSGGGSGGTIETPHFKIAKQDADKKNKK